MSSNAVRWIHLTRPREKSLPPPLPRCSVLAGEVCSLVDLLSHLHRKVMTAAALSLRFTG